MDNYEVIVIKTDTPPMGAYGEKPAIISLDVTPHSYGDMGMFVIKCHDEVAKIDKEIAIAEWNRRNEKNNPFYKELE